MDRDPFGDLKDRSSILDDEGDDPFAGLYSVPHHDAPVPPVRPPELSEQRAPGAPPPAMPPDLTWSEVPGKAMRNLPSSAASAAMGMVQPIMHPIQTYEAVKGLGKGVVSKARGAMGLSRAPENEKPVDMLVDFYKERYGSEEGFKHALAEDPVGVMADFSTFIGGGGSALARAPGMIGRAGEAVAQAGRAMHPLSMAATVASPALLPAMAAANIPLSLKSGAPLPSLNRAMKAGFKGSDEFLNQLSGGDPAEIVERAHDAVSKIADRRRAEYLSGMQGVAAGTTPIDYSDINAALRKSLKDVTHGSKTYKKEAGQMLNEIWQEVRDWQNTPNTPTVNYHNVEGVDKLKQRIGEMRSSAKPGSPADAVATKIYNAIRDTLGKHDPNYLKVMENYGDLSDQLKQLKTTLSVNPRASVDTTLRKLLLGDKQKDGAKGKLLKDLSKEDPEIANMIAGHLLSSWVPTGFTGGIGAALSMSPHALGAVGVDPASIAANALTSSPRVLGNINYAVGRAAHPTGGLPLMATAPLNLLSDAEHVAAPPPEKPEPRPYFGDEEDIRPARAAGGRVGLSSDRLIAMAKASRRKIQGRTQEILKQPDQHVVHALKVVNDKMQG